MPSIDIFRRPIAERWDEVVESLRTSRMLLAPFLEQATPSAISASGSLTVQADDEAAADALEMAKADMLGVVKNMFPAIERVVITRPSVPSASGSHKRVTEQEIRAASLQFVRKISGFTKPSKSNEAAFLAAVDDIAAVSAKLLASLETKAPPRYREVEAAKARERVAQRFATQRRP